MMLRKDLTEAEQRKEENLKDIQRRYMMEILHQQDVQENLKRLEKTQNLHREEYLAKMETEKERVARLQSEKLALLNEKKKMKYNLEQEKREAFKEFERKRKKLDNGENQSHLSSLFEYPGSSSSTKKTLAPLSGSKSSQAMLINPANDESEFSVHAAPLADAKVASKSNRLLPSISKPYKPPKAKKTKLVGKITTPTGRQVDVTPYLANPPPVPKGF